MKKLSDAVYRFLNEEKGTEMVEWAIVGGLVVAAGAAIFVTIGSDANTALNTLSGHVATAAGGGS